MTRDCGRRPTAMLTFLSRLVLVLACVAPFPGCEDSEQDETEDASACIGFDGGVALDACPAPENKVKAEIIQAVPMKGCPYPTGDAGIPNEPLQPRCNASAHVTLRLSNTDTIEHRLSPSAQTKLICRNGRVLAGPMLVTVSPIALNPSQVIETRFEMTPVVYCFECQGAYPSNENTLVVKLTDETGQALDAAWSTFYCLSTNPS